MRFNTFDCGVYHHTNLVPEYYELDDYQVRTPTDIIGQHIHLPKWDLTTADGAANGWNYEDGTLSPGSVRGAHPRAELFRHRRQRRPAAPLPGRDSSWRHRQPRCGHRLWRIDPAHHPDTRGTPLLGRSGGRAGRPLPRALGRRPGHYPAALVLRPGGQHRGRRPGTGHHFHPRPLRALDPPADRPVRDRARPSRPARPGCTTRPACSWAAAPMGNPGGRIDGGPTSWQAVILPPGAARP